MSSEKVPVAELHELNTSNMAEPAPHNSILENKPISLVSGNTTVPLSHLPRGPSGDPLDDILSASFWWRLWNARQRRGWAIMSSPQVALILLALLIVVLAVPWDNVQQRQRENARQQWEATWAKEKEHLEKERHTWEVTWAKEKEKERHTWEVTWAKEKEKERHTWEVTWAKEKEQLERERYTWEVTWAKEKEQLEKERHTWGVTWAKEKEKERHTWEVTWAKEKEQLERERYTWEVTWAKEKEQLEKERHTWELAWSLEKEQREKEQMNDEKRFKFCSDERPFGLNWEGLQGHHCTSYGWREYTARLFSDGCPNVPLSVSGKKKQVPYKCTSEESRKMGHWILEDVVCRTDWGELYDRGCVAKDKHRYEARLVNVRAGDDWERMCSSTPATIAGEYFPIPTFCENRGLFEMGVWDTKDPRCR